METSAYNERYLPYAMDNLAVMFDYGIKHYGIPSSMFFYRFITSGIAEQFEKGNPKYLVGHSGIELADIVIELSGGVGILRDAGGVSYGKSPEYWAGWVLAYYQWTSGRTFSEMQKNGLDIPTVIALYHPLHEADPAKFVDVAEHIISQNTSTRSPIKDAREQLGMTQKSLAEASGVSLRMIRAYEQKQQDLSKAEYDTVTRLARTLRIPADSLILP